jgi:hypothetical protein
MSQPDESSVQDQLVRAARDLWSSVIDSGDDYVIFMDHRRLSTRVQKTETGMFQVSWEPEAGESWILHEHEFDNPREAAFHGFQGPH